MTAYKEKKFWDDYGIYLNESYFRHKNVISFSPISLFKEINLLDLGCGQYASSFNYLTPSNYLGLDSLNPGIRFIKNNDSVVNFKTLDYREELPEISNLNAFVSLFSAEVTGSNEQNISLYESIFKKYNTINNGIVSGFYYKGKEDQEIVEEAGCLQSFQTNPRISNSLLYSETNIILEAPSKLFGNDVVEVWKFLQRR